MESVGAFEENSLTDKGLKKCSAHLFWTQVTHYAYKVVIIKHTQISFLLPWIFHANVICVYKKTGAFHSQEKESTTTLSYFLTSFEFNFLSGS